mgnify:FL=1
MVRYAGSNLYPHLIHVAGSHPAAATLQGVNDGMRNLWMKRNGPLVAN